MKKAFVCLLFASLLLLAVSCNGDIDNANGSKGSFPSWLEDKTFRVSGNAPKAVLMEEDNYFYVTCSGTSVYVDDRQSGEMSSYSQTATIETASGYCVAKTSDATYTFTTGSSMTLEISDNERLSGSYTVEEVTNPVEGWPLVIRCYEGPNQTDNVAVRIVVTPRGLYYLLCSNYEMYKNGRDPFQCEKDRWFASVENIEKRENGFGLSNSRGSFDFSYGQDGSITLVNGENTFVLKEKSFDYEDLIKNAECVGGDSHVHSYVVKERVEPTCKDGYEKKVCECGDSYTVVLPATGEHDWTKTSVVNCTSQGVGNGKVNYSCSVCGETKTETGHVWSLVETQTKETYYKNGYYKFQCSCGQETTQNAPVNYRDTIKFGTYDNEPIEWLILRTEEDGSALLLSKYILFDSKYADGEYGKNEKFTDSDKWNKNPYIRTFLNDDFYTSSFSATEKGQIEEHTVLGKVFLPARSEFGNYVYFDYYDSLGRRKGDVYDHWYWLLDFNVEGTSPYQATSCESRDIKAIYKRDSTAGIRPCIWVKNWESLK